MILDSLSNSARYEGLHPAFKQAFDFIKSTDFSKLEPGKIELNGVDLFVNFDEPIGKKADEASLEAHRKYIDIQVPFSAIETMGWRSLGELKEPKSEYNAEKDIIFFHDKATSYITVYPGQFVIFFPEDAHQPGIAEGVFRKIVVKVKI